MRASSEPRMTTHCVLRPAPASTHDTKRLMHVLDKSTTASERSLSAVVEYGA